MQPLTIFKQAQVTSVLRNSNNRLHTLESIKISLLDGEDVMRLLSACPSLKQLTLIQCAVNDIHLQQLTKLCPCIESVTLFKLPSVTDKGICHLAQLNGLKKIKICHMSEITETGLRILLSTSSSIKKITAFLVAKLNQSAIFSLIKGAKIPEQITLIGSEVTNELAAKILEENPHVQRLAIRCSNVSKIFIDRIVELMATKQLGLGLQKLKFTHTSVREQDVHELKVHLPQLEIIFKNSE